MCILNTKPIALLLMDMHYNIVQVVPEPDFLVLVDLLTPLRWMFNVCLCPICSFQVVPPDWRGHGCVYYKYSAPNVVYRKQSKTVLTLLLLTAYRKHPSHPYVLHWAVKPLSKILLSKRFFEIFVFLTCSCFLVRWVKWVPTARSCILPLIFLFRR